MTDLEHYQTAMQTLAELKQKLPDYTELVDRAASSVAKLLHLIPALELAPPVGENALEPASPANTPACDRFFGTFELFEHLLLYLDVLCLLDVQQVNHHFFDNIASSSGVQWHMGLAPDMEHDFRFTLPDMERPCFTDGNVGLVLCAAPAAGDRDILIEGQLIQPWTPRLGKRARSILLCQPPVTSVDLYALCCCNPGDLPYSPTTFKPTMVLHSPAGVTIGDLIDARQEIADQHLTCPHALRHMHDARGWVVVDLTFQGIVPVSASDRTLLAVIKREQAVMDHERCHEAMEQKVTSYMTAKEAGESCVSRVAINY
ncbi:hypothetical protein LTR08_001579 [Meristemomyces frigidus]|nr:hypothetical protein LTR08_001579 [Meristemomyces frigidus]